jgi:glucokinase
MADPCTIGIDVGGTKVLGLALDPLEPARPLAEREIASAHGASRLIDEVGDMVDGLRADVAPRPLAAVGIGLPGLVTLDGVLRVGPNLPGIVDVDMMAELAPRVGVPVAVDNDGNCAAWAEVRSGAARGYDDALFIGLGTGISCGLVVGGRVARGAHGFAGEAGHMTIVPGGAACACGRLGCWEAYGSGTGLANLGRRAAAEGRLQGVLDRAGGQIPALRGEHVTAAAVEGDAEATAVVAEFSRWVAIGLSSLANVLDPGAIVLGGTMMDLGAVLLEPIRAAFAQEALGLGLRTRTRLVGARLGRQAGAVGAGLLATIER